MTVLQPGGAAYVLCAASPSFLPVAPNGSVLIGVGSVGTVDTSPPTQSAEPLPLYLTGILPIMPTTNLRTNPPLPLTPP